MRQHPLEMNIRQYVQNCNKSEYLLTIKHYKFMKKIRFNRYCPGNPGINKFLLVMKLTLMMTLFFAFNAASAVSQKTNLTLNLKKVTLEKAFEAIEKQTGYSFFYHLDMTDLNKPVTINVTDKPITEVLDEILDPDRLTYRIIDNSIIIMQTRKVLESNAQQKEFQVTGKVIEKNGDPLPGVNVYEKSNQTHGVITSVDGTYAITVNSPDAILVYSFVGYETQEIHVASRKVINVTLLERSIALDEVVSVGYGTQKKSDLTGSVGEINSQRLLDKPSFNVAQAISGKMAGVTVIQGNGAPGGGNMMIRVRGTNSISTNNSPLVVVDGVVGLANALTILNPNDVKSVNVLKDASATAIYGARGANGVIIITTKRGIKGKTVVEYNGSVSESILQKHFVYNNAEQFLYVVTQAWMNIHKYATTPNWPLCPDGSILPPGEGGLTYSEMPYLYERTPEGGYPIPLVGRDGNYYKPRFDTNWESETFKPSISNNHELSIRGGNENARFATFLGYTNDNGLLINSYFKRISGKLNSDFKVTKWLDASSEISVNRSRNRTNDVSYFSGGISRAASESFPVIPPKYPNDVEIYGEHAGRYGRNTDFPVGEADCQNPIAISETVETFTDRNQVTGSFTLNFHITRDLSLKSNFAIDELQSKYHNYGGIEVTRAAHGSARLNSSKTLYWQNENYLNYNKTIGDHNIGGLLGMSWSQRSWENLYTYNYHFFDDFYKWHNIGVGTAPRPAPSSSDGKSALNSYFARVNYNYKTKYYLTFTARVDGSSKFGENSKYGFFPSAAAAWRITGEDFAKNLSTLSNLKLRFSVGQTGNQEIGSYVTQTFIGSGNVALGGDVYPGLWPSSVGNPDLRWEKNTQYDVGIDLGLFRNRIMLTADYYHKLTTDMLLIVPLPQSTTTGSVRENYGSVENKGFEFTLTTHNVKSNKFSWSTDFIFSRNKNTIKKLGPTNADIRGNWWVGGANTILRVGDPIGEIWGLDRIGTYSTEEASLAARYGFVPGDVKHLDRNNDGQISFYDDGRVLGCTFPKWNGDFTNTFNYGNFDLYIDLRFSYGAVKENRTNHSGEDRQVMDNSKNRVLDAWRPDHQNTMIGEVRPGMGGAYYQTYPDTHWVEDASFLRGEGATLGYTFKESVIGKIGLSRLRLYFNAKNFFVITKYTGYDPEGSDRDNMHDPLTPGMDFYMYPRPTVFSFGVNLIF